MKYLLMLDGGAAYSTHKTYQDAMDRGTKEVVEHGGIGFRIYELVATAVAEVSIKMTEAKVMD